jgi:hypothetical protein
MLADQDFLDQPPDLAAEEPTRTIQQRDDDQD